MNLTEGDKMKMSNVGWGRIFQWLVLGMLAFPAVLHAEDGDHRKKLSFDTTAKGVELKQEVSQLPVLVRLHSGNFTFSEAKPDGSDLRFFAADGKTPLKYHIENFDAANELANIWVLMPKVSANSKNDAIVVAWGNTKAESASGDSKSTYDASQILVFHFNDAQGANDATGNANNAKVSTAKRVNAGPIGAAAGFDGSAKIEVPASATLKLSASSGFTFTAWVKPAGAETGELYQQQDGGKSVVVGLAAGTLYVSAGGAKVAASAALKPGAWQHVAAVIEAGKATLYLDGNPVGNGNAALADMGGDVTVGKGFHGEMDEVAVSGAARSAAYVRALFGSQGADSAMVGFADDDGGSSGSSSVVSILLGAVTIDGWIVIALLMVMAVVSFYVMITKARMLRANAKANGIFLDAFKEKSEHLLMPGDAAIAELTATEGVQNSAIFRLYQVGLHEVSTRFEAQQKAGRPVSLTAAGLDSIRAALDAAMVRETQKLNNGIVLLTIAIAGGPFLGLLGTVVGVMITFAAIAAAGDVNVNAIAPGIAAALVATVAGLAVAIPALFGYNWLVSQIKNASADSQVFLDEFLTKSAEMHSV